MKTRASVIAMVVLNERVAAKRQHWMERRLMKRNIALGVAGGLAAVLALTNPKMADYEQFIHASIVQGTQNGDALTQAVGSLFSGLASAMVVNFTTRSDFLLFSLYETKMAGKDYEALGILGHFFMIRKT